MKRNCLLIILILASFCPQGLGQNRAIDSLRKALKVEKDDTNKVNIMNAIASEFMANSADSSISFALQAKALAEKIGWIKGQAISYSNAGSGFSEKGDMNKAIDNYKKALKLESEYGDKHLQAIELSNIGNAYYDLGNYTQSLEFQMKALELDEELADKELMAQDLSNIANNYYAEGNYPVALDYYLNALKIAEELKNKHLQTNNLCNLGNLYDDQGEYLKALENYMKALKIAEDLQNKQAQAFILGNIGLIYKEKNDFPGALDYYKKALKLGEELGNKEVQAIVLGNMAVAYKHLDDYANAQNYQLQALDLANKIGDKQAQANDLGNLGSLFIITGKYKDAEMDLKKAIDMDSSLGVLNELRVWEESISGLYETTKQYALSLSWYKKAMVLKDTLFNADKNKALTRKEVTYQYEKKEATEKAEQDKKDAIVAADKKKQKIIIWAVLSGLALALVFAGFIFRSLRITRSQKQIIEIKNEETEKQKTLIERQKILVEEKNKDILDSITYAKRLQDAILPPLGLIKQYLPESFLLYKPKDIVAGDFYWVARSPLPLGEGQGEVTLIAAADCTGHGVPGALVSVVCSNALNRTVKEFKITEPGKILDKVRELVLETFEKSEGNIQDGMDISLLAISPLSAGEARPDDLVGRGLGVRLQWSGAYNSLWYIRNKEVIEVPADKQPIGKVDKPFPFSTYNLNLQKGDTLYLFTDGYADQFGGPKGKKFKYKQMQQLIMDNAQLTMEKQKQLLEQKFEEWKGSLEQVDDVLMIGIRV